MIKYRADAWKCTDDWNREASLKEGRALTRDGRLVVCLGQAVMNNGETVIVENVSTKPIREYKNNAMIQTEQHFWRGRGGLGCHGGDDLMTLESSIKHKCS